MTLLFKTLHGSHLYGLAHEGSDLDYYNVVEPVRSKKAKYAKQSIVDGIDSTTVDWGTWVNMCQAGVPQALEAMFSRKQIFEAPGIAEFRAAFRFGSAARDKYHRTIDNFLKNEEFKKNRHALRLSLNLAEGMEYERFNPTLSKKNAIFITYVAKYWTQEDINKCCWKLAYNMD